MGGFGEMVPGRGLEGGKEGGSDIILFPLKYFLEEE